MRIMMRRLLVSSWILLLGPPVCRGQDFYSLSAENISGEEVEFSKYEGKVVLVENTATL